jgi:hypothetical protein
VRRRLIHDPDYQPNSAFAPELSIEVTLSEMSTEAGGFLLPEDACRVQDELNALLSASDIREGNREEESPVPAARRICSGRVVKIEEDRILNVRQHVTSQGQCIVVANGFFDFESQGRGSLSTDFSLKPDVLPRMFG